MKNNSSQKGFAMPMIIAIVAVVLVLGGVVYYSNKSNEAEKMSEEKAMMEKETMEQKEKDAMMMEKDFDAVIAKAPSINLKDVSKSGASGTAWLGVYNGKTYHRVIAKNMPALPGNDFYEGWLVKNAATGDFFSTGKMTYDPATKEATLDFVADGDKADYRFVVITSEHNDGNPKPDKHIIEERFPAAANLQVSIGDAMMEKKEGEMMKKDEGAMMDKGETTMKYSGAVLAGKSAPLLDFTKADYDAAIKSDKLVVLYFYANWCPICKAEVANALYPAFNELTTDKVVGFQVSYNDSDTDSNEKSLASQFGVAYQHTKVFVKDGKRILKSPEGWDENRYETEINKALGQ
ncbi:thioredoxin family protein [bacterium]|nr:thioredoxin family protein [bacterium]